MKRYKYIFKESNDIDDIVNLIKDGGYYIFASFDDHRIDDIEKILNKHNIPFITTSQTGRDHVIAGKNNHFYKKFKGI